MFIYLLLLFLIFPVLEISLLIQVGKYIGFLPELALICLTAFAGAHLTKVQGRLVLAKLKAELKSGNLPQESLLEGLLILAAGLLLLTPGFISDTLGLFFLIPTLRRKMLKPLKFFLQKYFLRGAGLATSAQTGSGKQVFTTYKVEP